MRNKIVENCPPPNSRRATAKKTLAFFLSPAIQARDILRLFLRRLKTACGIVFTLLSLRAHETGHSLNGELSTLARAPLSFPNVPDRPADESTII